MATVIERDSNEPREENENPPGRPVKTPKGGEWVVLSHQTDDYDNFGRPLRSGDEPTESASDYDLQRGQFVARRVFEWAFGTADSGSIEDVNKVFDKMITPGEGQEEFVGVVTRAVEEFNTATGSEPAPDHE